MWLKYLFSEWMKWDFQVETGAHGAKLSHERR